MTITTNTLEVGLSQAVSTNLEIHKQAMTGAQVVSLYQSQRHQNLALTITQPHFSGGFNPNMVDVSAPGEVFVVDYEVASGAFWS